MLRLNSPSIYTCSIVGFLIEVSMVLLRCHKSVKCVIVRNAWISNSFLHRLCKNCISPRPLVPIPEMDTLCP